MRWECNAFGWQVTALHCAMTTALSSAMSDFFAAKEGRFRLQFFCRKAKETSLYSIPHLELFMVVSLSLRSALNAVGAFPASLYGPIRPLAPRMEVRYG